METKHERGAVEQRKHVGAGGSAAAAVVVGLGFLAACGDYGPAPLGTEGFTLTTSSTAAVGPGGTTYVAGTVSVLDVPAVMQTIAPPGADAVMISDTAASN